MATHSSALAWRIQGTREPGGLLSLGSQSRTRLKRLSSSSSSRVTEYQKVKQKVSDKERQAGVLNLTHGTAGGWEPVPKVCRASHQEGEQMVTWRSQACPLKAVCLIHPFVAQVGSKWFPHQ